MNTIASRDQFEQTRIGENLVVSYKTADSVLKHSQWTISEFSCASVLKRVKVRNHSYENDFDLHENETAYRTHFHMKGFALRLVLKQRQRHKTY